MDDLNFKFSRVGADKSKKPELKTDSLNLKIENGQFTEVKPIPVTVKPIKVELKPVTAPVKEEYFENLFEPRPSEQPEQTEEIPAAEEFFEESLEEQAAEVEEIEEIEEIEETEELEEADSEEEPVDADVAFEQTDEAFEAEREADAEDESEGSSQEAVSQKPADAVNELADEIFEGIVSENTQQERYEDTEEPEITAEQDFSEVTPLEAENKNADHTDSVLEELSKDTVKGKYDFLNLCVLTVMILFLGMTFIFMKQSSVFEQETVEFSAETVKTGEYTLFLTEKFTENMPLSKAMAQLNVLFNKLYGKTELVFPDFSSSEPPDGPIDNDGLGGESAGNTPDYDYTTTTTTTFSGETTTTGKIPLDFFVTTPKESAGNEGIFTGRPIGTTTGEKTTTTLDLPETTKSTTSGKVSLVLPEATTTTPKPDSGSDENESTLTTPDLEIGGIE